MALATDMLMASAYRL